MELFAETFSVRYLLETAIAMDLLMHTTIRTKHVATLFTIFPILLPTKPYCSPHRLIRFSSVFCSNLIFTVMSTPSSSAANECCHHLHTTSRSDTLRSKVSFYAFQSIKRTRTSSFSAVDSMNFYTAFSNLRRG